MEPNQPTTPNPLASPHKALRARAPAAAECVVGFLVVLAVFAAVLPVFALATGNRRQGDPAREREKARQATCISNLKQLDLALLMYAQDYDEKLPPAVQSITRQVAEICPHASGGVPMTTLYDEMFPYMKSAKILQCPSAPQAVDLCEDVDTIFHAACAGRNGIRFGSIVPVGDFRYGSYVFNYTLFGLGGFTMNGVNVTDLVHKAGGSPYPKSFAQVNFPADTPALYDGYVVRQIPISIAIPRHAQTATVAFMDGHVKPLRMVPLPAGIPPRKDPATGRKLDAFFIDHGPYRANPGRHNAAFNGIVTDPVCAIQIKPETECLKK
jgi:prepilin-type processing-associated H-X9-DG protein